MPIALRERSQEEEDLEAGVVPVCSRNTYTTLALLLIRHPEDT